MNKAVGYNTDITVDPKMSAIMRFQCIKSSKKLIHSICL